MSRKKPKKRPNRGSGVSVTLPTEPLAGAAKDTRRPWPSWCKMTALADSWITRLKAGNSIQFRVGWKTKAFMERVGPAPDGDLFLDADSSNVQPVTVEYEHALSGPQRVSLGPGGRLTLNPVMSQNAG